jgi:Wax ester synthase-like Acyl-CoA acyltransferase domain
MLRADLALRLESLPRFSQRLSRTRTGGLSCFYSHRLDRTRPLWEMALIHGPADGRWALAHKTHHCLVDELVYGIEFGFAELRGHRAR